MAVCKRKWIWNNVYPRLNVWCQQLWAYLCCRGQASWLDYCEYFQMLTWVRNKKCRLLNGGWYGAKYVTTDMYVGRMILTTICLRDCRLTEANTTHVLPERKYIILNDGKLTGNTFPVVRLPSWIMYFDPLTALYTWFTLVSLTRACYRPYEIRPLAEIHVISYLLAVNDRLLWFPTSPAIYRTVFPVVYPCCLTLETWV